MRPFARAVLHAILWPAYAAGFIAQPIVAGFRFGQAWARKAIDWLYKDVNERAVQAALDKARKKFPNHVCRAEGDVIIVEAVGEFSEGVKH